MADRPWVRLAAVVSLDGKIKKNTETHTREWISKEDKARFASLVAESDVLVMGRKTYRNMLPVLPRHKHCVVYTRNPTGQPRPSEQVAFTNDRPRAVLGHLYASGYKRVLITGGSEINTLFLADGLVDEVLLTVEPVMHGIGRPLLADNKLYVPLMLEGVERLNAGGTLLLTYRVLERQGGLQNGAGYVGEGETQYGGRHQEYIQKRVGQEELLTADQYFAPGQGVAGKEQG